MILQPDCSESELPGQFLFRTAIPGVYSRDISVSLSDRQLLKLGPVQDVKL